MSNLKLHLSTKLDDFSEVVLLDTEFIARESERVLPVCLVAHELRSGRQHRIFFGEGRPCASPLTTGDDVLYVAYAAQAEWSTFLALGWDLPVHVLDLFSEFRNITNGLVRRDGSPLEASLLAALRHYGLEAMAAEEKDEMRDLILRGQPYSSEEKQLILDYCAEDVAALERLLSAMMPQIDLPDAIFRGRYSKAVARMEYSGVPLDVPALRRFDANWDALKEKLANDVEREHQYGVYVGTHWGESRFASLLSRIGILSEWPRTPSGRLATGDEDVFKPMAVRHPALAPLRDLRATLTHLRSLGLKAGHDGRSRCSLMPYRSVTGRNYPPSSRFPFSPSTWLRSLIKPEPGRAIAYVDWSSAEFGIAAALSGDTSMIEAYESGDVYLAFAIQAGAAPKGATKKTHGEVRDVYKVVVLATQYGQSAIGLAERLGVSEWRAQELLDLHRRIYRRYWEWIEWISQKATFRHVAETVFGWRMHVTSRTKPRTISNFPMQAHGAEMLRWACCYATEAGVEVHAPVQDALLVGGSIDEIDDVVDRTQEYMARASALVLDGFRLRTDVKIVRSPDRYVDERGRDMWQRVLRLMDQMENGPCVGCLS